MEGEDGHDEFADGVGDVLGASGQSFQGGGQRLGALHYQGADFVFETHGGGVYTMNVEAFLAGLLNDLHMQLFLLRQENEHLRNQLATAVAAAKPDPPNPPERP